MSSPSPNETHSRNGESSGSLVPARLPAAVLISALEFEKLQLRERRESLRRKMAEAEAELVRLTSRQAELQKLDVSLDRLLKYLQEHSSNEELGNASQPCRGLANAAVAGTF